MFSLISLFKSVLTTLSASEIGDDLGMKEMWYLIHVIPQTELREVQQWNDAAASYTNAVRILGKYWWWIANKKLIKLNQGSITYNNKAGSKFIQDVQSDAEETALSEDAGNTQEGSRTRENSSEFS